MRGFVEYYTVWIHHGETTVVDNDDDDEEDDAETLEYLSQYSEELDVQMDPEFGMNKVVMQVVGMVTMKVVPIMIGEHVLVMKMILMIWRK